MGVQKNYINMVIQGYSVQTMQIRRKNNKSSDSICSVFQLLQSNINYKVSQIALKIGFQMCQKWQQKYTVSKRCQKCSPTLSIRICIFSRKNEEPWLFMRTIF